MAANNPKHWQRIFPSFDAYIRAATDKSAKTNWTNLYSRRDEGSWSGCSWTEAIELAAKGWTEGRARMVQGLAKASVLNVARQRNARSYGVAGAYPMVVRAVAGDPLNMVLPGDTSVASKPIVRLLVPRGASASVQPRQIENYGIALLSHVNAMEIEGYSVELVIAMTSAGYSNGECLDIRVTVKRAGERLDLDRLAFVLAHPAMLRRFEFALCEQTCPSTWQHGYGRPMRLSAEQIDKDVNYLPGIGHGHSAQFNTLAEAIKALECVRPGYNLVEGRAQA